jgi:hypothetical protein
MNSQTSLNKENVQPALPGKGLEKPREFGRDVTNNTFADINKDWPKEVTNTETAADPFRKNIYEELETKEARVPGLAGHPSTKEVMEVPQGLKREETLSTQVSLRTPKEGEKSWAVEN